MTNRTPTTTNPTVQATPAKPAAPVSDLDAFVNQVREHKAAQKTNAVGLPRLIFGLDATGSRQPTWDMAVKLQSDMFREVAAIGGLAIQFVYFRGNDECRSSGFKTSAAELAASMSKINCLMGVTQIGKVLTHVWNTAQEGSVRALVFVGDSVDGDKVDDLLAGARDLAELKVPAFMFQEGNDPTAEQAFRAIADATKGAYCRFDAGSADQLRELLKAVAVFATGGVKALAGTTTKPALPAATLLLGQLPKGDE